MTSLQLNFDLEQFEEAAKQNGIRYWIAHEFMASLGYESWASFQKVINKSMASCAALNVQIQEAFIPDVYLEDGKEVSTWRLTRFACFLVTMHADSKKPRVAEAKTVLAAIAVVEKGRTLYDFMGKTELAANLFRVTQTAERIKNTGAKGVDHLSDTAHEVGGEVRRIMLRSSGVAPESLPLEEDLTKVKGRLKSAAREMKKLDAPRKSGKKR